MCKAMNRSLANVLFAGVGTADSTGAAGTESATGTVKSADADDVAIILDASRKIMIVPGYGLAVAQAQHAVRELADLLTARGAGVMYAIHPVAGRMPGHMNVLLAEADIPYELLLDLEVLRSGEARGSSSIPLTTQLDGSRTTENLTIPGQSLRLQKRVALPAASESGHGWLSIPADGNARDNVTFFAYGPDRPAKSLIVAADGESAGYLELAAAPPGFGNFETQRVDPAQAAAAITADLAAIVWAAPLPTGPAADTLQRFLTSGGHVLFLPPGIPSTTTFNELQWADPNEASAGKFFILSDWNRSDGPLRDGIDGTPIAADRLKAIRRQIPQGDATPLARWEDGEPALTRRIFDRGTAWFLGSIPDYTWSNLGDADVLLPAIQRIITAGHDRFDASYIANLGSPASRLMPGETRSRIDDYGSADPANTEHEAGIHRLGERLLALNRPPREDAPEILTREILDRILEGTNYTLLDQAGQAGDPNLSRDVWRAFLIAVLFFLISEALLCLPKKTTQEVIPQATSSPITNN